MRRFPIRRGLPVLVGLLCSAVHSLAAADKLEFAPVAGFPQVPVDITLGRCSAVALDSRGQVYLFHRGKSPLICFDSEGKFVRAWGDDLIKTAHGLRIDRDDNLWVTDIGHHLVMKFNPEGKLLLALGSSDKPGTGTDQFDRPTDVAFGSKGEVYVSDGYGNSRVMVFDAKGKFLRTWGTAGKGPGEFNTPHSIRIAAKDRILVGDRENKRIQVFDREGKFLEMWDGFAPYGLEIYRDGDIFVADGLANQIIQLDQNGKIVHAWGSMGKSPGQFDLPHMLASDHAGNLYVTEINGMRMQKFTQK